MPETQSRKLLKSYLDEKQLHDFEHYEHIWVIARDKRVFQIKDGTSVIQWSASGQGTSFHVWASDAYGEMQDMNESLLTQFLFLSSDYPDVMLERACTGGRFWHDDRGAPKMRGRHADENGKEPRVVY